MLRRADGVLEAVLRECLADGSDEVALSPLLTRGIVVGITHVARGRLLAGELAGWAHACDAGAAEALVGLDAATPSPWSSAPAPPPDPRPLGDRAP